MSLIQVTVDHVQSQNVRSRVSPAGFTEYSQRAYFWTGGKFPIEMQIRLPDGVQFYQAGDYVADIGLQLSPDKYGSLSLRPFSITTLIPVSTQFIDAFVQAGQKINEQLKKVA